MNPSFEKVLRRDYRGDDGYDFWLAVWGIAWVAAVATILFVLTPTVHASRSMDYTEVHTEVQLKEYLRQHPYAKVINL